MNHRPYRGFCIKPKGKVKLNINGKILQGEWIEGYLCDDFICYCDRDGDWGDEHIVLETVGQHTGCIDENMTEIFEGDRVVYNDGCCYFEGTVRFKKGSFVVVPDSSYSRPFETPLSELCGNGENNNMTEGLAVVGTEFDAEG